MRDDADDHDYRVVIDEAGLDWRGQPDTNLREIVDDFSDLLEDLADGRHVAIMTSAYGVECWESVTLVGMHYTDSRRISRDARVRLATLLDRCRTIELQDDEIPQPIQLHGTWLEPSWGMAHALARAANGRAMSCLIGPAAFPPGWTVIERRTDSALEIHLLNKSMQLPEFWRGIYHREKVSESAFFELAEAAFPNLIFHQSLTLHRFRGNYQEILPWLTRLLAAVNDHFAEVVSRHHGDHDRIIAEFSTYGVSISPESPQTHNNPKAWAQRIVTYKDIEYRCEWHGKRLWDRDRVHFSLPIKKYSDRILVGVFTDHLLL
jgi:hypothetical protein